MSSRVYPEEMFQKEIRKYLIPIRPITQIDILEIKAIKNREAIVQLINKININHCL